MRRHRVSPLVAAGGVAVVLLLGGASSAVSPARPAAPPVALASMTLPAGHSRPAPPPGPPPPPKSVPIHGSYLGGVDLNGYCRSVGYGAAKLLEPNPYGWVCFNTGDDLMASITVNDACQWQGTWDDVAVPPGDNDPNRWSCWSVN
jgi:hypothetical protein